MTLGDTMIDSETSAQILQYLQKYEYGTLKHTVFSLLWDTGFRVGTLRAVDLGDYHSEKQFIEVEHRAETGTPLKNKYGAEREVNLHEWVCDVIDDYVEMYRHDITDDHGREPLITTEQGRPVRSNIRGHINSHDAPCVYAGRCPHDRDQIVAKPRSALLGRSRTVLVRFLLTQFVGPRSQHGSTMATQRNSSPIG